MGGLLGENGGGLFVLAYLACTIFIGLPIMIVETLMGRMTQSSPVKAFQKLTTPRSPWVGTGWMGILAGFAYRHLHAGLSTPLVGIRWAEDQEKFVLDREGYPASHVFSNDPRGETYHSTAVLAYAEYLGEGDRPGRDDRRLLHPRRDHRGLRGLGAALWSPHHLGQPLRRSDGA